MWRKIRPLFTGLGIILFIIIAGCIALWMTYGAGKQLTPLPSSVVLTMRIDSPFMEQRSFDFNTRSEKPSIHDVVFALHDAAEDPRVKALYVRLSHQHLGLSEVQELQTALNKFHENGKILKIYSENYAGMGSGIATYYFASFFHEVWMQPTGNTDVSKIEAELPFFKAAMDKIGVKAEITRAGRYKNAPESFLLEEISPESDLMMNRLITNIYDHTKAGILQNKQNLITRWDDAVENSPLTDNQSLQYGLISKLGYFDEFDADLTAFANTNKAEITDIWDYNARTTNELSLTNSPQVAFVLLDGVIPEPDVKASQANLGGGNTIIPQDIEEALLTAAKNPDIKAILVRVNSPGGSPSGSETIRRAIEVAKEKGKKVYVSMGTAAASGGYWVVTDADMIFANPATMTGSIGVYGGKMSAQGLWEKLGIKWNVVSENNPNHFWSPNFNYSEHGQKILDNRIQTIYGQFIDRVTNGRKLPRDTVEQIAEGQVWTGLEAYKLGLIDHVGGIDDTIATIKRDIGVAENDKIILVPYPQPQSTFDQILKVLGQFFSAQITLSSTIHDIQSAISTKTSIEAKMQEEAPF